MNKRDRKVVKKAVLWTKKGYNLHKRGDASLLASYEKQYTRMVEYRMRDDHSEAVANRLEYEADLRVMHVNSNKKYHRYFYTCRCF